jgi:uncharacterized protein YeaO (DUF488 family)
MIKIKRTYDEPSKDDGFRILIDRLWPRGLSKERAKVDLWLKDIAPSDKLRKWFAHDPKKWKDFERRYGEELTKKGELLARIKGLEGEKGTVTLLYSAKDQEHNDAVVLMGLLHR